MKKHKTFHNIPHIPDIYRLYLYKVENYVKHDYRYKKHKTFQNNVFAFLANVLGNFECLLFNRCIACISLEYAESSGIFYVFMFALFLITFQFIEV